MGPFSRRYGTWELSILFFPVIYIPRAWIILQTAAGDCWRRREERESTTTALSSLRGGLSPKLSMSDWAEQFSRQTRVWDDEFLSASHPRGSENPSWTVILYTRSWMKQENENLNLPVYAIVSSRLLTHLSATSCGNPDSHWPESMSNRNKCTAENLHTNLAMYDDNVYYTACPK